MKTFLFSSLIAAGLCLASCSSKPEPQPEPVQPAPVEQEAPQREVVIVRETQPTPQPTPPAQADPEDGTSVKVNRTGVVVKSKKGERVTNVDLNMDSSGFEFKRPR
ncbi:MAG: hypothetical protein V4616_05780 [Bacteroidota bacterium]